MLQVKTIAGLTLAIMAMGTFTPANAEIGYQQVEEVSKPSAASIFYIYLQLTALIITTNNDAATVSSCLSDSADSEKGIIIYFSLHLNKDLAGKYISLPKSELRTECKQLIKDYLKYFATILKLHCPLSTSPVDDYHVKVFLPKNGDTLLAEYLHGMVTFHGLAGTGNERIEF